MEWLVLSLLKYARIEAGVIILKKEKVVFDKLIEIVFEGNVEEFIYCDFNWFKEALINIVKNAVEHSKKDSKIIIKIEKNNLFTRIYIEDFGEGIKKKDLPYIFERFKKFSNELKPNSIGIGLALSKTIVKKLDGDIYAKSIYKKGTKFIITFLNY
jgi:signal transduction histidine kinase